MRHFIITDIEGVAGIDSFKQTRSSNQEQKAPAMDQLGREVNACIRGIRSADPEANIDVWDGHGSGGLREVDVQGGTYSRGGRPYFDLEEFDAMYFVGQHAMAGTAFAPLAHTYSSRSISHYKLNGTFIGEFGCRALVAGVQSVPTVFLAGDDKACRESEIFIPTIETVSVKRGIAREAASHLDLDEACDVIQRGATRAANRIDEIAPLTGIEPPYELEIRFHESVDDDWLESEHVTRLDERTIQIESESLSEPNDSLRRAL